MILIIVSATVSTATFCAWWLIVEKRLRSARREVRRLGVELDLATEKLGRVGESSGPTADSDRDEAAYTEEERRVMNHLVIAWNLYVGLPEDHPDDADDFKDAIHTLQRIVLANVALRKGR